MIVRIYTLALGAYLILYGYVAHVDIRRPLSPTNPVNVLYRCFKDNRYTLDQPVEPDNGGQVFLRSHRTIA